MIQIAAALAGAALVLVSLGVVNAGDNSAPAYIYCMRDCNEALDREDPTFQERQRWFGDNKKSDEGKAFERFKTCLSWCSKLNL